MTFSIKYGNLKSQKTVIITIIKKLLFLPHRRKAVRTKPVSYTHLDVYKRQEELASSHSVRNVIGDEFTLDNLKAKFKEIMSMNVKPSTNTNLLNVKFDWEGNMIDKTTGNVVEDTESIHSWEYQADTSDGTEDSSDDSGY